MYPLHFITLLIVTGVQFLSYQWFNHGQVCGDNSLYNFILNVFFISPFILGKGHTFNLVIWSVSIEIFVYFFFYFVSLNILKWNFVFPLFLTILFSILQKIITTGIYVSFEICAMFFFWGVTLYALLNQNFKFTFSLIALLLGGLMLTKASYLIGNLLIFTACVILAVGYLDVSEISKVWGRKIKWIGEITYGVYLVHLPIQVALMLIIRAQGYSLVDTANHPFFFMFYISLVLLCARLSYLYIERPAQKWIRNKFT